jgi:hypothetical protein
MDSGWMNIVGNEQSVSNLEFDLSGDVDVK